MDTSNRTLRYNRSWKQIHGRNLSSWEFDEAPKADKAVLWGCVIVSVLLPLFAFITDTKLGG